MLEFNVAPAASVAIERIYSGVLRIGISVLLQIGNQSYEPSLCSDAIDKVNISHFSCHCKYLTLSQIL